MSRPAQRQQGSMLLPVIVAMVLLGAAGAALSEVFAAQRMSNVGSLEAARSYWAAEAGVWHASLLAADLSSDVNLEGATYTVQLNGGSFTAQADYNERASEVTGTVQAGDPQMLAGEPLHVASSSGSAYQHASSHCHLALVNVSEGALRINSFSLSADQSVPRVTVFRLGGVEIWGSGGGVKLPTAALRTNSGTIAERTIDFGGAPDAYIEFDDAIPSGGSTILFTLTLTFTDASSSSIPFSVRW